MPDSRDVINVVSQLYISDLEIEQYEFKKRLDQWVNFFMTYWNLLVEPVKEEYFETHVLKLDYNLLLELDVPPSVEAFKKDFYSTPELVLSAMSSSLHIYTCFYLHSVNAKIIRANQEINDFYLNKINNNSLNMKITDYLIVNTTSSENLANDNTKKIYNSLKDEVLDNELNNLLFDEGLEKFIHFNQIKNQNVVIRIFNYKPVTNFVNLRSHTVGCVASIIGQIIRISKPKTLVTAGLFTCCKCDKSFFKRFKMGLFDPPTKCIYRSCDSKFFILNKHYVISTTYQTLRLQEYMIEDCRVDKSKTNSTLDIQVTDDLIGTYNLGNLVNILGIIKTVNRVNNVNLYKDNKLIYKMYLKTISVSVINNKNSIINFNDTGNDEKDNFATFIKDIYYNEPNRFYLVAASLFPNLKGKYYQKVGLLLSLMGGVNIYDSYNNVEKRGNIHVLLLGEPGVGKSHMLSCISNSLGNYMVSASNITNSGLTAGLVKDNNEFALEAGVLVLLNNSTLCIDELDKLNSTDLLLEVMEAQKVSIAKGGIVKTLKAQTTLICASNPIHSRFNLSKDVLENIRLSRTLLSRFDLVFLMINDKSDYSDYCDEDKNEETDLIMKLKSFSKYDLLSNVLISEYIEYGKKYINPIFTREASEELGLFFRELIELNKKSNNMLKLTTRQLQGLIRLCQSRARGDLLKTITREHVKEVVEIFKNTIYYPNFMNVFENSNVLSSNDKKRKKDVTKIFINELKVLLNNKTGIIPNYEMYNLARDIISKHRSTMDADELIYKTNNLGYILKQGTSWRTNL